MSVKYPSVLNRIVLLVSLLILVTSVALGGAEIDRFTEEVHAADAAAELEAAAGQAVKPDRISFYNVPSDHKLESHIDYADGREEKISYPAGMCAQGTVITQQLNLYTATFIAEACEETVFQQLNLRWMGGCTFEFEYDPDALIVARGPYGEVVIANDHYPAGELQLNNIPANTTSIGATMSYLDEQGRVLTGNVGLSFNEPHPGCGEAQLPTPTATGTPITIPEETPTPTATSTAISTETVTSTPTASQTPVEGQATPNAPTPTATSTETPTVTPRPTQVLPPEPPTSLDPTAEPNAPDAARLYLPLVVKSQ